jgi:hypothetical protein
VPPPGRGIFVGKKKVAFKAECLPTRMLTVDHSPSPVAAASELARVTPSSTSTYVHHKFISKGISNGPTEQFVSAVLQRDDAK